MFFFIFVNMPLDESNSFPQHLLWKYTLDSLPKLIYTPKEGLYQSW